MIAVVTGTRAEYGLLRPLMKEICATEELSLRVLVTGAHLTPRFGETWREIEADGFTIAEKIDMEADGDGPIDIARSMGRAMVGFAESFARQRPDIVVILGDRYEMLAVAQAAMLSRIPIAHLNGGEATEGLIDEAIRHSITKMSHFHFTSCKEYRERVIQLGETPESVYNVGATAIDNVVNLPLAAIGEIERAVGMDLGSGYFLVTYHPVTLSHDDPRRPFVEMLKALDRFPQHKLVVTGVNADPGNRSIADALDSYAGRNPGRVRVIASLGTRLYLGAMKHCAAVVGNSSSGISEAPSFPVPTVNIGDRQRGRVRARSIIDCGESCEAIAAALAEALSDDFRAQLQDLIPPFGKGGASRAIAKILCDAPLDNLLKKRFHNITVPAA